VGEPAALRGEVISCINDNLPESSFKYLMGVGKPQDILESVERGIDLFDCVIPTRLARTGTIFTDKGRLVVRNAEYKNDLKPLDTDCGCFVCRKFSRAYLRHLINAGEISGARLLSYHNVWWFSRFMQRIRKAVEQDRFFSFKRDFLNNYQDRTCSVQ
jgi:queuine tRNA-ribosyltransferase